MPTKTEVERGRRLALIVATGSYSDPTLAKLRAPGRDATDLAAVLSDKKIGAFKVETALEVEVESLRRQIAKFCRQANPSDLVVVYLSCHGVLDDRGRLYYASADTDRELLSATAIPSIWLNEQLEDCRSRRQVLILDCCHSGAFARGAKGEGDLALSSRFQGRGRIILTGSRGTEYSFEHDEIVGEGASSVFTGTLVEGLRSGDADRDGDGVVTVDELYDYAYDAVRAKEARQTPTIWTYGAEGSLRIARNPKKAKDRPGELPSDLTVSLESARPEVRRGGVEALAQHLKDSNPSLARIARARLHQVADEDIPMVADAAAKALGSRPRRRRPPKAADQTPSEATTRDPRTPPTRPHRSTRADPLPPEPRDLLPVGISGLLVIVIALTTLFLVGGGDSHPQPVGAIPADSSPGTISVGGAPGGVAATDGTIWVSRYDDGLVTRIDPSSQSARSAEVGEHPGKVAAGAGTVWVSVEDGRRLVQLDRETGDPSGAEIDLEAGGCGGCAATQLVIKGRELLVGSAQARTITAYNAANGRPLDKMPYRPGKGFAGVFTVGEGFIWALANNDTTPSQSFVVRLDPRSPAKPDRISVGSGHFLSAVAFGQGTVWVADAGNGISQFHSGQERLVPVDPVETGLTSADLAYRDGSIIVWDPASGVLTRIFISSGGRPARQHDIAAFVAHQEENEMASDCALDGEFAWLTEPAGDKLHKVKY